MGSNDRDARLSQLATRWSLLWQAHAGEADAARAAQWELLQRYGNRTAGLILHDLDPHLSLGLYAVRSTVSFRKVVIEPLPAGE